MNARERWLQTLLFGTPDKIPLQAGHGRESTWRRWHQEGLPEGTVAINEYAYRQAGGTQPWPHGGIELGSWGVNPGCYPGDVDNDYFFEVDSRMVPQFEEKVVEQREGSRIVQDWKGNICEIGNEYTVEYLRGGIDFVTRRWIKCPVESRDDWEEMKSRYDPEEPSRFPEEAQRLGQRLSERDWPVEIVLPGPFWQLRDWLGFESLCMMFHDDPDFVLEMLRFWEEFIARLLEKTFSYVIPDSIHINEDMAYKSFSMISPDMTREFLFPAWSRWGKIVREAGCPLYAIDSDGYIGELIPIWIEAGFNLCGPVEVAAGNDLVDFRRRFGGKMAYRGGVDKRAIAAGGKSIRDEIKRLEPVVRDGGFIPGCDHSLPHDISWSNYVDYVKLLAQASGWGHQSRRTP